MAELINLVFVLLSNFSFNFSMNVVFGALPMLLLLVVVVVVVVVVLLLLPVSLLLSLVSSMIKNVFADGGDMGDMIAVVECMVVVADAAATGAGCGGGILTIVA